MKRVCQGLCVLFGLMVAGSPAADGQNAAGPPAKPTLKRVSVSTLAWKPGPFADVVLDTPDLAACFVLSPGWWTEAGAPPAVPESGSFGAALGAQLDGFIDLGESELAVMFASTDDPAPSAVTHGNAALVLLPHNGSAGTPEVVRVLAPVLLHSRFTVAAPDERAGEPLLAAAESLVQAGALALAALPPALRPVRDWAEPKDMAPALAAMLDDALDPATPWSARESRLRRLAQPGGASQELAQAGALLLEAFGDVPHALARPFDLLGAWREDASKKFPPAPSALRRALSKPLEAGMPKGDRKQEVDAVEFSALARALAAGIVPAGVPTTATPSALRLLAVAQARAQGNGRACAWVLAAPLPGALRTGCRSEGESAGLVFSRPLARGGFEIVARSSAGDEGVLLRWPHWVLFPQVAAARGELLFVDPSGVWSIPLDGSAPARLRLAGAFRHLAVSPGGGAFAVARWPAGAVVVATQGGVREIGARGRGGIAWVESDVLATVDGDAVTLASPSGETRPVRSGVACVRTVAARADVLLAGVAAPCPAGLVRVPLAPEGTARLLALLDAPLGIVVLPDGSVVFGTQGGLHRWNGGERAERIGGGLTPGPG